MGQIMPGGRPKEAPRTTVEVAGQADSGRKRRHSASDGEGDENSPENIQVKLDTPSKKRVKSTSRYIYDTLFVQGRSSDITVVAMGREWHMHRVYLCQSDYFASMFNGSWEESSKGRIEIDIVDENITEDALNITFGALYSENVKFAPSTVVSILAAASMFQLRGLLDEANKFMLETVAHDTVGLYFSAANLYGVDVVENRCREWLRLHLLRLLSLPLLRSLNIDMLLEVLRSTEFFVLQVEMDIYTMLKQWLYLQVMEDFDNDHKKLSKTCETYFRLCRQGDEEKRSFLATPAGESYVDLFRLIRLQHVVRDVDSCQSLENDGIIPSEWLADAYREQWFLTLLSEQKGDNGPASMTDEYFYSNSMRFGRVLSEDMDYCWRWIGFSFGFDMVASYRSGRITIRRNTTRFPCSRSVNLQQEHREIVIRAQAFWEVKDVDNQFKVCKSDSGRMNLYLRPDEEALILTVPNSSAIFPLYLSFRVAFTGQPAE